MFTEGANAGVERRVSSYVPAAGSLALGNSYSSNTTSGDDWEMQLHLPPSDWNTCINAALRRCTRRREAALTIVDGYNQYSLAALTDLTRGNQVLEVYTTRGPANQKRRQRLVKKVHWDVWEDDDALTLDLTHALNEDVANSLQLWVAYNAAYASLDTDAATTTCDLDWVTTGTLLQAMEMYPNQLEEPAKRTLKMTVADLQREFRRHSMAFAPARATTLGVRMG